MPLLFQRRFGTEQRAITAKVIREMLNTAIDHTGLTDPATGDPLRFLPRLPKGLHHRCRPQWTPAAHRPSHRRAPRHHVTMGYKAVYPDEAIQAHLGFLARRRSLRPSEEYRVPTDQEWTEFLGDPVELRKVVLGTCGRDHGTPCAHENAWVRCPLLRVNPAQMARLEEIHTNVVARLQEAKEQGWLGEVAAIETTRAAAEQKLSAMRSAAAQHTTTTLGMPGFDPAVGRSRSND